MAANALNSKTWQDLRVLIAGCGSIGRRHARVLAGLGVRHLSACDPMPEQRRALQAEVPYANLFSSYAEALADSPDAVFICTPTKLHIPMACDAVRAGCHVFCEKPLSLTTEGIDELDTLAGDMQRQVMVGLCSRYHEGLLQAKQMLASGRIGRVVSIRCLVGEHLPDVRPDYRNLFSAQYSGAFDLIHEIDLAIWYADQPVHTVHSLSGTYSDIGIQAPDVAEVLIGFADRCLASVHLDFFQRPRRRQTELLATEGTIIVEYASWDRCTVSIFESAKGAWHHQDLATRRDDMFRAEDEEFLRRVAAGIPVSINIAEGKKSVEVVERCMSM